MSTIFKRFLLILSVSFGFAGIASSQALTVGTIENPGKPSGNQNYLLSSDFKGMTGHSYVFYSDSNASVGYIIINNLRERLTFQKNGENLPVYTNAKYTVVINMKKTSDQTSKEIESLSDKDDWSYQALDGSLTISDMTGKVVAKPFIGAKLVAVKK